ncbi:MAG: hypothetical protein ACREDH_06060 [Methylocella sp.]
MHSFGISAPMKILAGDSGFNAEQVAAAANHAIRHAVGGTNSRDVTGEVKCNLA